MDSPKKRRGRPPTDPVTRFWSKVEKTDSCWNYVGQINYDGYGHFSFQSKKVRSHRYSWELANGPIPPGMIIDHICRNRACVNPRHLRIATNGQNMQNQSGPHAGSQTGFLGVRVDKRRSKYFAKVTKDGRHYYGRYVDSPEEASEEAKEIRLSVFTHNEVDRAS